MRDNKIVLSNLLVTVRGLFNLRADMDEAGTVESVRANVDFRSANAWTLVFAILLASVGLNVNSTAVIIGAMLISPLMGPIVGAGLALGIADYALLRRSLRNLAFAVLISILTSALYFIFSPLSEIQSELLARTRPTFYDVLVAVFGGAAGIVALSRKERGTAVAGVAIATALMPPLCTAGFGLATGEFGYFIGAFYLFLINSVFICLSTYVFSRYMKFERVSTTPENILFARRWMTAVALVVLSPSLVLAYLLQQETLFRSRASEFINRELQFPRTFIVNRDIKYDWERPRLILDIVGESLSADQLRRAKERLAAYHLPQEALEIRQSSFEETLEKRLNEKLLSNDAESSRIKAELGQKESELSQLKALSGLSARITEEIAVVMPTVQRIVVSANSEAKSPPSVFVVWRSRPTSDVRQRLEKFLSVRIASDQLDVSHVQSF